jgi:hypothetical protein
MTNSVIVIGAFLSSIPNCVFRNHHDKRSGGRGGDDDDDDEYGDCDGRNDGGDGEYDDSNDDESDDDVGKNSDLDANICSEPVLDWDDLFFFAFSQDLKCVVCSLVCFLCFFSHKLKRGLRFFQTRLSLSGRVRRASDRSEDDFDAPNSAVDDRVGVVHDN